MISNGSGRYKQTDYKDFMPRKDKFIDKEGVQLATSSPDIMRDRIAEYNRKHPNDMLKFDYDKTQN